MASLYLLRHGETLFNVQHKTQGWCDSPLTERGIRQAQLAGEMLASKGVHIDIAYSSTSERCCDTLELATEAGWGHAMPYTRLKGLKEHNFGAFEAKDQFLERFPHGDFYKNYGGESEGECLGRFSDCLHEIMRGVGEDDTVLAVSHGGVGIMFFNSIVSDPEPGTVPFGNCICYHYEYCNGTFSWVETLVPDLSSLERPGEEPQIRWR